MRLIRKVFASAVALALGCNITSLASAQSALAFNVGLGYSGLGYALEENSGAQSVDFIHGPQLDIGWELGLGRFVSVGLDADLTVAEAGKNISGRDSFALSDINAILSDSGGTPIVGNYFGAAALVGIYLGDFHPSVGLGYLTVNVEDEDREPKNDFNCLTWLAKPLDFNASDFITISFEYEQTLSCDFDATSLSLTGRVSF